MRKFFHVLPGSCVWFPTCFPAGETGPFFSTPAYLWHGRGWGRRFTRVDHLLRVKMKNLEHLCSLGDMLHDMLAKSSKSNSFKLCWTLLYRAEPILYGKFFESCHFALNLVWTWHESTSNRWASFSHQLVRLYSTEICTALLANGSSVQKKNTHARIPALCRSLRLWFLIEPCWATLSWLSIQWATLVEYGLVISIAAFLVAGDKLSIRRTFANRMTTAPGLWIIQCVEYDISIYYIYIHSTVNLFGSFHFSLVENSCAETVAVPACRVSLSFGFILLVVSKYARWCDSTGSKRKKTLANSKHEQIFGA